MKENEIDLELSSNLAYDKRLIHEPGSLDFGNETDEHFDTFRIRIGRSPYVINLTELFLKGHTQNLENYTIFKEYNYCLLFQTMSVLDSGGLKSLSKLGYRMRFINKSPVTVVEVLPRTEFIEIASGKVSVTFDAQGSISSSAKIPETKMNLIPEIGTSAGAKLVLATDNSFKFNLSFSVLTPQVIAIGSGDNYSEWIFHKNDKPLLGTHQMVQLILIRKSVKILKFESNVYGTVSLFGLPTKYANDIWVPLEIPIPEIK
jgi:hypothetical protein